MFRAFRTRFPTGSLVSELIEVERGLYVVRACVQCDGTTLASGFAAAATIEAAEDAARARAIAAAGLDLDGDSDPNAPSVAPASAPASPSYVPDHFSAPVSEVTPAAPADTPPPPPTATPAPAAAESPERSVANDWQGFAPSESLPEPATDTQANWWDTPDPLPVLDPPAAPAAASRVAAEQPATEKPATEKPKTAKSKTAKPQPDPKAVEPPPASGDSTEYADIIARTSVELKRLRWTNEQGRKFLEETYGKRSRQLLDESELREFLTYLESQPTPR